MALIALGYVALLGVETSVLSDRLARFQRTGQQLISTASSSVQAAMSAGDHESTARPVAASSISTANSNDRTSKHFDTGANGHDVGDELLTPEFAQQIGREQIDPFAPVQVHMVWIGDISNAPKDHTQYAQRGFNLTVHTNADEILAGFQPFVKRAYRLAVPDVVGYDFLKFALLYKHGGLAVDADTTPAISASEVHFPSDCDVVFGKEATPPPQWEKPVYRDKGGADYGLNRPFQILNWAMAAAAPRNKHVKWLLQTAMMHFFGLRDMEGSIIQDVSGSGLMTDYVALLHEKQGRSYRDVYRDNSRHIPVEGLCLTLGHFRGHWIHHAFLGSWKHFD